MKLQIFRWVIFLLFSILLLLDTKHLHSWMIVPDALIWSLLFYRIMTFKYKELK